MHGPSVGAPGPKEAGAPIPDGVFPEEGNQGSTSYDELRFTPREMFVATSRGLLGGIGAGALYATAQSIRLKRTPLLLKL